MVLASLAWREVAQCCSWKQFLQVAVAGTGPFFPRQWSTVISCQQRRRQHASFQQAAPHSRHLLPAPACARLCCWKKAAQQWRQRSSPARGTRVSRRSAKCAPKQCAMECGIQVLAHTVSNTVLTHCVRLRHRRAKGNQRFLRQVSASQLQKHRVSYFFQYVVWNISKSPPKRSQDQKRYFQNKKI